MLSNKQIVLKNYLQGCPKESDFELRTTPFSTEISHDKGSKAVLLKNLYLACDPYVCHILRPRTQSLFVFSPVVPGSVVRGYGVAKVIKSSYDELKEGDYVWGITGWENFTWNFDPEKILLNKIDTTIQVPLSYYAGLLGLAGAAAYVGWNEICSPKRGETVYVSSAAGGVGHLVGQFAKMMGCYVVGSASTHHKVDLLKTKLGFDDAFNYKEGDLRSKLKMYFPKGIDIYFDNVGGETLDEVLLHMNINGRIAVSGLISQYNLKEPQGICNMFSLIEKRLTMRGFLQLDHQHMYPQYVEWAVKMLQEKKLIYVEDVSPGFESAVSAFVGIFQGRNIGKQIVLIASED